MLDVEAVEAEGVLLLEAHLDADAGLLQPADPLAGDAPIGIHHRDDDTADPGVHHRVGTGRRAALVGAGLEGDVERSPSCARSRAIDRQPLGVRLSGAGVEAFAGELAGVVEYDRTDHGVGAGEVVATRGELERSPHPLAVGR